MKPLGPFTTDEKLRELEEELAWRHRVYAKSIKAGRMKPEHARRKIAILNSVIEDYRRGNDLFSPLRGGDGQAS